MSDGNAEAHACICNYSIRPAILTDDKLNADVAYPYGRLPLLYPWHLNEFCENSWTSRISVDKRFHNMFSGGAFQHLPAVPSRLTPDRGFRSAVCSGKVTNIFLIWQMIFWFFCTVGALRRWERSSWSVPVCEFVWKPDDGSRKIIVARNLYKNHRFCATIIQ